MPVCVDVRVERSASTKSSIDVYYGGVVKTTGGTDGATIDTTAGAKTVALEETGTAADLGMV